MSILALTTAGWVAIAVGAAASLVYVAYWLALPKPFPGIPYNKESAKRIMGDIPELDALAAKDDTYRYFWPNTAITNGSPITQVFMGPFTRPNIVISDYREAHDLMVKRGKDLGRGKLNRQTWAGIVPEHFIGMDDHEERFSDRKGLVKDLMTPKFLHEANAPASYQKMLDFVKLWQMKAELAQGRPFNAFSDLASLTFDIIMAAAVGLDDGDSEAVCQSKLLHGGDFSNLLPSDRDAPFPFPVSDISDLQRALHTISKATAGAFIAPSKPIYHFFSNRTATMRAAYKTKKEVLQSYIDKSTERYLTEGEKFQAKSAVDYIVSREITMAEKAGRAPELHSPRLEDMLFGYLLGGQDSTHTTLSFLVKRLSENQESQKKLRDSLRKAYPEALARGEQPVLTDILKTSMPYLDAWIEEVLRLSDPTMVVSKETLCDMDILGQRIPKGTIVAFSLTGPTFQKPGLRIDEAKRSESAHKVQSRDGRVVDWTESAYPAGEFWPERWLRSSEGGEKEAVFDQQAGPFLAFSSGKRGCWGKRLAYLELKLVGTLLLWNFDFERTPEPMNSWKLEEDIFVKPKVCCVRLSNITET